MKILNFGSLNLDYVYHVDHFVSAGETIGSVSLEKNAGGKGLNQSVAFAKAGAAICHAGCIGEEGAFLSTVLSRNGVDTRWIKTLPVPTGHAIIQVDRMGENCILLYGGANQAIERGYMEEVLSHFGKGDWIVLQNEISDVGYVIHRAHDAGLITILNPSPITPSLLSDEESLSLVDWFILNEGEGQALSGETDFDAMYRALEARFPHARIVLTLGEDGALCRDEGERIFVPAEKTVPVDTTAAGDTFTGYFFTMLADGKSVAEAMRIAAHAAAITVTRKGAAESIPVLSEVLGGMKEG